jgi:ABC-type uncharacterized transport system permease subunit
VIHALGALALAAYVVSVTLFSRDLYRDRARNNRAAEFALLIGFISHTVLILSTLGVASTSFPSGRADFYLFLSWGLPIAYALLRRKMGYPILGAFLGAATILFLASSSYLLHLTPPRQVELSGFFLALHVVPALVAELCLVVAVVLSLVFRIQSRRFKSKRDISAALTAPSLDLLDRWNVVLLSGGFVAISFSVITGSVWALFHQRSVFTSDPFQWMGFLVWVLLAIIHITRAVRGRSAGVLSKMTLLAGFILISTLCVFLLWGKEVSHAAIYLS